MSKDLGTLPQAARLLGIVSEQGLNAEQVEILHPLVSALAQGVSRGRVPTLDELRKFLGLNKFLGAPTAFAYPAIAEPADPSEFYQTREGLWVDPDFVRWVLPAAKKLEALPELAGQHYPLVVDANDGEIRGELPQDCVWEADEFCTRLAVKIQRQWDNKTPGNLLNNGYANIFYVRGVGGEVFAVDVDWSSGAREWRVYAGRSDDGRWSAGNRAFPRN